MPYLESILLTIPWGYLETLDKQPCHPGAAGLAPAPKAKSRRKTRKAQKLARRQQRNQK